MSSFYPFFLIEECRPFRPFLIFERHFIPKLKHGATIGGPFRTQFTTAGLQSSQTNKYTLQYDPAKTKTLTGTAQKPAARCQVFLSQVINQRPDLYFVIFL